MSRASRSKARHRSPRRPGIGSASFGALAVNSRFVRLSTAGAVLASVGAGSVAVARSGLEHPVTAATGSTPSTDAFALERAARTSRDQASRPPLTPSTRPTQKPTPAKPRRATVPKAVGSKFVVAAVNVRVGPGKHFAVLALLPLGTKVAVTGRSSAGWAQVLHDGKTGWVKSELLSSTEPTALPTTSTGVDGISSAPCADGSAVEEGLRADTIRVHRAVCARFPGVDSYGGLRGGGGEHAVGRALDIMISDQSEGDSIAEWVRAHHTELGVSEVIWAQHIWTVERSGEGWRPMEDRGSVTANHYDHVHVTTYGDAGTV